MSDTDIQGTNPVDGKMDRLLTEVMDLKVTLAKVATTQDFMARDYEQRVQFEKEMDVRLSKIETNYSYATGIIAVVVLVVSFLSNFVIKKVTGA